MQWLDQVEAQAEQTAAVGTHRGLQDEALVVAQEHLMSHQRHIVIRGYHR